jgi:hypothetical protein
MITVIGAMGGVNNMRLSMSDITNDQQLLDIVKTKIETEEFEKQVKGVKKDVKKLSAGIMAKPETEEIE